MISMLSGILGFATSGLPNVLKFFQQKGDQKHERDMAQLATERSLAMAEKGYASQERIEESKTDQVNMQTYAEERKALYQHDSTVADGASQWVTNLRASVRPIITYVFIFLLLFVDIAGMIWAINSGVEFQKAMDIVFSDEEMAIVASIIGFWFGSRHWGK
tara:strand:- start:5765 stop:6247 length:483 start_codon:yes stop_codon:yes gene_type:complete